MKSDDLMTLHRIIDTLAAKSTHNETLVTEAHAIINKLVRGEHFCGPWQSGSDEDSNVEECVICGAHRVAT